MTLLLNNVVRNKFVKEQIIKSELFILRKLNFKFPVNYFLDFSFLMLEKICGKLKGKKNVLAIPNDGLEKEIDLFKNITYLYSISVHKMIVLEYEFKCRYSNLQIYFSILYFACKYINYLFDKKFSFNSISKIALKNGIKIDEILKLSKEIYKLKPERYEFLYANELLKFQF